MCNQTVYWDMQIMRFLYEIMKGKTWWGMRQDRERDWHRERERDLGRGGEQHSSERKWRGLILTVGLNQQHLRISTTPENFLRVSINNIKGRIRCQSSFWVAFIILRTNLALQHSLEWHWVYHNTYNHELNLRKFFSFSSKTFCQQKEIENNGNFDKKDW